MVNHPNRSKKAKTAFEKAAADIKAGRARGHALWILLGAESDRDGYALKPSPWEGPGSYQHVSVGDDLGYLVLTPGDGRSLPTS